MLPSIPKRKSLIASIPIFCKVFPWQRPRKGRNGQIYQPKENHQELMAELDRFSKLNLDIPIAIDSYIYFQGPKDGYPVAPRYGDEDNLRKGINDCLQGVKILKDDRFVIGGETYKQFADENFAIINIHSLEE